MSGAQTSTFPDQNKLLEANAQQLANYYAPEKNRLLIETAKQEAGQREMEVMSRIATGLMGLPEDQRANAYPGAVQYAQSLGFAKNAPPVYPGHERVAQLASLGIPAEKQYEQQGVRTAANSFITGLTGGRTPAAGGTPAVPGGAYGTGGGNTATVPPELMPHFQEASARTGIPVDVLIAQARQESSFNANAVGGAGEIGIGQILPSTARNPGYGLPGVDPAALKDPRTNINFQADYLKALLPPGADPKDPAAIRAALLRYNGGGDPNYVNNVTRYLPAPGGTTTAAAPAPRGVAARIPGAVDVAGPGAGGTTAEQSGNQPLLNRLSVFGGGAAEPPPVAPAVAPVVAPAVPAAPAVAAPTATAAPAPSAVPPPVLPPLPPAPQPTDPTTGLTRDQTQTLVGQARIARTPQQLAALEAQAQTYRAQNDTRAKEYEQAVYTRNEKAQADQRAAAAAKIAEEQNTRGWRTDLREEEKADRERVAANQPFPGKDPLSANKNILWKGSQPGGDTSTPEYRDAYQAVKYQTAPNGSIVIRDMPWAPPTGKGAETMKPPSFIAQPSDTARNEVRKADNDAIIISQAIDHYVDVFGQSGKNSWDAYWANPQSPEGQRLLGAFDAMKTTLRSPVYYNTGVLQPAEMKMLQEDLVSPQTLRGLFATPQAMASRLHEIKMAVITRQDQELRSIGQPGSIVRNDKEFDALPPGATFYDKNGNKRQKPEAQ